ncbi:MAG: cytochrome P460 family protein [Abitibacteriaceae bacterium]|nr:cytochrome P460 family protein [Abditibacteriaceae bacterium]MBV9866307.1 cytochrome P460 family protein [Abditibacteriaceae bacterium]
MKYAATSVLVGGLLVLSVGRCISTPNLLQLASKSAHKGKSNGKISDAPAAGPQEIADYRKWTLVNPTPYYVPAPRAAQCARTILNPHDGKFIKVYVNDIGQQAMLTQKIPQFAAGSVIVKEKLSQQDSPTPELLTVMIKREAGYDPAKGDWEYMMVDGTAEDAENRGKLGYCQACHIPQQEQGYIFRTYLPDAVRENLR